MATKSISFLKGRRFRVTRLDSCGRPVFGDDAVGISKGMVSTQFTRNTTEVAEIAIQNSSGDVCVYEPAVQKLTGYTLEIVFCNVDMDIFSLMTGAPKVFDAFGDVVGFDIGEVDLSDTGFAFELWMGVPGEDCEPGAQPSMGYLLLPYLRGGMIGDLSVANAEVNFTINNATTRVGNAWGVGPHNDVQLDISGNPGPMVTPISSRTHLRLIETQAAPPEPLIGTRPLLDSSLPSLTSIAGVEGATTMTVEFATTPAATGPVWWEFGDGEWDYVAAPGAASHVYDTAGTYTVRASQNTTWVTTTVTVPFA